MELKELLEQLNTINDGDEFSIDILGSVDLKASAKKEGNQAFKISQLVVRKGINYSELESVKKKIDEGYELTSKLPWGEWSTEEDEKNLIINHKNKKYLHLYPSTDTKTNTVYFLNNKVVSKEELKESNLVLDSFFKEKTSSFDVMNVETSKIISISQQVHK